jgi:hypothetical protein
MFYLCFRMEQQITIKKDWRGQQLLVHCLADMRDLSVGGYGSGPRSKKVCLWILWVQSEEPFFFKKLTEQEQGTFKHQLMNIEFHFQHGKDGPLEGSRAVVVKEGKSLR